MASVQISDFGGQTFYMRIAIAFDAVRRYAAAHAHVIVLR
jgi:hypothetical protein